MVAFQLKLYHRRPADLRGTVLYPLNQLARVAPDLYQRQREKYQGRDALMEQRVPQLNCLWNDVLHLSPVHPARLGELANACELVWSVADWFEFDAEAMGLTANNTAIFRYCDVGISTTIPADEFEPYDAAKFAEMTELPSQTRECYAAAARGSAGYFMFVGIPHVLHRGALSLDRVPLVRA